MRSRIKASSGESFSRFAIRSVIALLAPIGLLPLLTSCGASGSSATSGSSISTCGHYQKGAALLR